MIIIRGTEIEQRCGMCGRKTRIKLTESEFEAFESYLKGGKLIQECLPTLNKVEREFLKSSYCANCQELLFGNGKTKRLY